MKPDTGSREICFLLGAGASQHAGVPTMATMWKTLFEQDWERLGLDIYMDGLRARNDHNIETLLQHLHESSSVQFSPQVVPQVQETSILAQSRAYKIIEFETRKFILHSVDRHHYRPEYDALSSWIPDDGALDVFSLNYDLVIEDFCRRNRIPLHDGFDDKGRWAPVSWPLASRGIRLWKLHGSINWRISRKNDTLSKVPPPRTFGHFLTATHAASPTAEVELIWPAVYKEFEGALAVMREALFNKLSRCGAVVIAGYRCSDPGVVSAIQNAYAANPRLKTFVVCGSTSSEVAARLAAKIGPAASNIIAVNAAGGQFPHVLKSLEFAQLVQSAMQEDSHATCVFPSHPRRVQFLCPGKFTAICRHGKQLVLAGHEDRAVIYSFDLQSGYLQRVTKWVGSPRNLTLSRTGSLLVADCKYCPDHPLLGPWLRSKSREGIGCIRIFDFETGRFRVAGFKLLKLLGCLGKVLKAFRNGSFVSFRQFDGLLEGGILSWPTSILDFPTSQGDYLIGEARNLTAYKLATGEFKRISGLYFFNLIGIAPWDDGRVLVLEGTLENSGSLWMYDFARRTHELLLVSIPSPGGFAALPATDSVYISSRVKEGFLYKLDMRSRALIKAPFQLKFPGKILADGNDALFVLTSDSVVRVVLDPPLTGEPTPRNESR